MNLVSTGQSPRCLLAVVNVALIWGSLSGCESRSAHARVINPPRYPNAGQQPSRRFVSVGIDTVKWLRPVQSPNALFVGKSIFVVQDGRTGLVAFTASGEVVWQHDVKTDGLNHIANGQIGEGDTLFFADQQTGRMLELSPSGAAIRVISLERVGRVDTFVPLPNGQLAAVTADSLLPLVVFDRSGAPISREAFPWAEFQRMSPLARQGYAVADRGTSTWGFAFAFGDGFNVFDGSRARAFVGHGVERVAFPDIIQSTRGLTISDQLGRVTFGAQSVGFRNGNLLVLFQGNETQYRGRVVDRYESRTGKYIDSFLLPQRTVSIGVRDQHVYALTRLGVLRIRLPTR